MKVLGFDPGVSKSGWAIICSENGLVDYGFQSFKSSKDGFNDKINEEMKSAIPFFEDKISGVDAVAWEIVPSFGRMNQRERVLSIASVVKVVTFQKEKKWFGRTPTTVKKLVCGNGRAEKAEVRAAVESIYPQLLELKKKMKPDVYDAIAIGHVALVRNEWEV